ncbi:MAG: holo-ACP synthase [Deltaproteobacteria bacterium]
MTYGIGIDIVHTPRIKKLLEGWGDNFKRRIFTEAEISYCERHKMNHQRYASSFAVKEALLKALGIGMGRGVRLRDIETARDGSGRPSVIVRGAGKEMIRDLGITSIHVSISHDGDYAAAFVVLEKSP